MDSSGGPSRSPIPDLSPELSPETSRESGDGLDPIYPDESLPAATTDRPSADAAGRPGSASRRSAIRGWTSQHLRLVVAVAVVVVAATIVLPLSLGGSSGGAPQRGASSAPAAAQEFLVAIRSGNAKSAIGVSCPSFANQARQAAHTAHLSGFTFSLGAVHAFGASATAVLIQKANVGGTIEKMSYTLNLQRTRSHWLVCGRN